jgi:hypothetical protein
MTQDPPSSQVPIGTPSPATQRTLACTGSAGPHTSDRQRVRHLRSHRRGRSLHPAAQLDYVGRSPPPHASLPARCATLHARTSSAALGSMPHSRSASRTALCPCRAAACGARKSRAPHSSRERTAIACPWYAAHCSGVAEAPSGEACTARQPGSECGGEAPPGHVARCRHTTDGQHTHHLGPYWRVDVPSACRPVADALNCSPLGRKKQRCGLRRRHWKSNAQQASYLGWCRSVTAHGSRRPRFAQSN